MLLKELAVFDVLNTPIWVVHPFTESVVYANPASRTLSGDMSLKEMRNGIYSTCLRTQLQHYLRHLDTMTEIFEIWTLQTGKGLQLAYCETTLVDIDDSGTSLLFEAVKLLAQNQSIHTGSRRYQRRNNGFFVRFFITNTAPMLSINPSKDGRIVDANIAVLHFYHCSDEEMRSKHTWQVNTLDRDVIPIMNNIANMPGRHKPLNFTHILTDGTLRHVQTYAGPVVLYNIRLMPRIIHDVIEEMHLEKELEFSAVHDPLTGLLNRRGFYRLVEAPSFITQGFCLPLIDIDHSKSINDIHGHQKGDEVLLAISHILEMSVDREDKIYRWGGEEFLFFLSYSPIARALILAEGIRQAVSEHQTLSVTVSTGVAEHHDGEVIDQLFSRIDKALYVAKNGGRDRVSCLPFEDVELLHSRGGAA